MSLIHYETNNRRCVFTNILEKFSKIMDWLHGWDEEAFQEKLRADRKRSEELISELQETLRKSRKLVAESKRVDDLYKAALRDAEIAHDSIKQLKKQAKSNPELARKLDDLHVRMKILREKRTT